MHSPSSIHRHIATKFLCTTEGKISSLHYDQSFIFLKEPKKPEKEIHLEIFTEFLEEN